MAGGGRALSKPAPRSGSEPFRLPEAAVGILLILPAILLLLSLTLYPVLYGVWISFFNKHSFFPQQTFIGLDNYAFLLRDPEFWASVWRGTVYALSTIVLQIVFGVAAALLLNEIFPGRNILRAIVIFPYVVPTVVAVIVWKWLLNSQFGLVNYLIEKAGLVEQPISFMGKDWIMVSLIIVSVWQFFPFVVIGVLARLRSTFASGGVRKIYESLLRVAEPARPGVDVGGLGTARLHGFSFRLDGLDRAQAFAGAFRNPADALARACDARQCRSAVRRDAVSHLFPQQPDRVVRHRWVDVARFGARRLRPHALSLPWAGDDRRAHPLHLHVRADHDHHSILRGHAFSRADQHASRIDSRLHCLLPAVQPLAAAHLLSEHPARDRGGRDDRRQPVAGGDLRGLAARLARRDRDRHLHIHPGLERLYFRARAAERRRDENAAGRNRRSLQRQRGRLGNDHGGGPSGDRTRCGRFRFHSEVPCRRLGFGRSEGLIALRRSVAKLCYRVQRATQRATILRL